MATVSSLTWVGKHEPRILVPHPYGALSHGWESTNLTHRRRHPEPRSGVSHHGCVILSGAAWAPWTLVSKGQAESKDLLLFFDSRHQNSACGPGSPLLCPRAARSLRIGARFAAAQRTSNPLALGNRVDAVHRRQLHRLLRARRPVNLRRSRVRRIAQSEVQPPVVRTRYSFRSPAHPAAAACRSPSDRPSRTSHRAGSLAPIRPPASSPPSDDGPDSRCAAAPAARRRD